MPKIEEMYAFCAEESPGDEGVIGTYSRGSWIPLVGADTARVDSLREIAIAIAKHKGIKVTLKRFKLVSQEVVYGGAYDT